MSAIESIIESRDLTDSHPERYDAVSSLKRKLLYWNDGSCSREAEQLRPTPA